jgi:hypothetical protein
MDQRYVSAEEFAPVRDIVDVWAKERAEQAKATVAPIEVIHDDEENEVESQSFETTGLLRTSDRAARRAGMR